MEKLENIIEKIINSENGDLDNSTIEKFVEANPEYEKHLTIISSLAKTKSHLSTKTLSNFVLYRNKQILIDELNFDPSVIENHINKCRMCKEQLHEMQDEYKLTSDFVEGTLNGRIEKKYVQHYNLLSRLLNVFQSKYSIGFATVVLAMFFSLFTYVKLFIPEYKQEIDRRLPEISVTRGSGNKEFREAVKALRLNDYKSAIKLFSEELKLRPNQTTSFYINYLIGISYLQNSHSKFIGLIPSFNDEEVQKSIIYFEKSIEENSSGKFKDINSKIYYYLGVSHLLLNEKELSKKYFSLAIESGGEYMVLSETMIGLIN